MGYRGKRESKRIPSLALPSSRFAFPLFVSPRPAIWTPCKHRLVISYIYVLSAFYPDSFESGDSFFRFNLLWLLWSWLWLWLCLLLLLLLLLLLYRRISGLKLFLKVPKKSFCSSPWMDKTFRNSPAVSNRAAFWVTSNTSLILTFSRIFLKHIEYSYQCSNQNWHNRHFLKLIQLP